MPVKKRQYRVNRPRCGGRWTEAEFTAFVKNVLRGASMRWAPVQDCKRAANARRGFYTCAACKENVPLNTKDGRKKVKNIHIDHIEPVIDPLEGFTTWDRFIERLFVEVEGFQILCYACHKKKTNGEKAVAKARRDKEKDSET